MAYVPIPKDLKRVKTKVAFNLTKRQLIGFSIAGLLGFSAYIFVRKLVPNDIAVLFLITAPFRYFLLRFLKKTAWFSNSILSSYIFIGFISRGKG